MKNIVLLSFIIISSIQVAAQDNPYKYFKLDNKAVTFDAIYDVQGVSAEDLKLRLIPFISTVKGLGEIRENSIGLTAVMSSYEFDYRAMGYKMMTVPIFMRNKISGMVSVMVKDERYRVVISNIISDKTDDAIEKGELFKNSEIESVILKFNESGWATRSDKIKMNKQMEEDFYKSFLLKDIKDDW